MDQFADERLESKRYREWVFTINNYTDTDKTGVEAMKSRYLVYGYEVGKNGTPHLQGYVAFPTVKSFNQIKKLMPRCWTAPRAKKSTPKKASDYCKKDGNFFERGDLPHQGQRCDMVDYINATQASIAETGKPIRLRQRFIEHTSLMARYPKFCADVAAAFYEPPVLVPGELEVLWYVGSAGAGKSLPVWTEHWLKKSHEEKFYKKKCDSKFWSNYDYQDTIYLEDLAPDHNVGAGFLKELMDYYPFEADIKHGNGMLIRPRRILVTSQYYPRQFPFSEQDKEAIMRRIKIVEVKK